MGLNFEESFIKPILSKSTLFSLTIQNRFLKTFRFLPSELSYPSKMRNRSISLIQASKDFQSKCRKSIEESIFNVT